MKTNFTNSLIKYLIEKYSFNLINTNDEALDFSNGSAGLIKNYQGTTVFLEVIDADRFDNVQLARIMENSSAMLDSINGRNAYVLKLFLFDNAPNDEVLDIIEKSQIDNITEKKFFKCMSVDISNKIVRKHYNEPTFDGNIVKAINKFFAKNLHEKETSIEDIKELLVKRSKDFQIEFKAKTPWVTYVLIAANILVWLLLRILSFTTNTEYVNLLAPFGAKINLFILEGEYWRFISAMFLHSNEVHLLLNCYSLYMIGTQIERLFGHVKMIVIYFVAGLVGSIASFAFNIYPAVGASGAIFGLLGAMLFFAIKRPSLLKSSFGANLLTILVINLVYGVMNERIDNSAHLGGLVGGFLTTGVVYTAKEETSKDRLVRIGSLILVFLVTIGGLFYSFNNESNRLISQIVSLDNYYAQKNYAEAEKIAEQILNQDFQDDELRISVLKILIESENSQDKYNESEKHAEELLKYDIDNNTKINALFSVVKSENIQGKHNECEEHAEELLKMNPQNSNILIDTLVFLSGSELAQGKYNESEEHSEQLLKQELDTDKKSQVLWNLSLSEAAQGNPVKFTEAEEHANQLIELSPKHGHFILGAIYYNTQDAKNLDKAKEHLQKAKELDSPNMNAINNMLSDIENIQKSK
ncbi:rhomboid family intramembrane serine protease [Ruminiclostridium herbifermentans]|uniref:Rhomboid family intramembrane serine protease n=1 Tax=Ruminiclostridium herbifermentans TaxID=2488810 RepID=A0A4U7JL59_9FIRM|nr:rhomboid family intramembrane serine protease [Ruminiclostridium herbifermentans]QNU68511.1 rhomboid family intramembrane serine protease [Ruminiclostridium herbifermentans]